MNSARDAYGAASAAAGLIEDLVFNVGEALRSSPLVVRGAAQRAEQEKP